MWLFEISFCKRRTYHFFLCQKEKSSKKEVGKPFAWPAGYSVLRSHETSSKTRHEWHSFLAKTSGGFWTVSCSSSDLGKQRSFLDGCADKTLVTPTAYFSPAGCCEIVLFLLFYGIFAVILAKAHWGLNHDAGMSADLWRHPPAPIQAKAPTNRGTRYRTR